MFSEKKRKIELIPLDYMNINSKVKELYSDNTLYNNTYMNSTFVGGEADAGENYLNNKSLLVKDFGTSKSKKVIDQMKTNIVKEENITNANKIQEKIQDKKVNQKETDEINKTESLERILPEYDLITNDVNKIFKIESIVSDELISKIQFKDCLNLILQDKLKENESNFCPFVYEYLSVLADQVKINKNIKEEIIPNVRYSLFLNSLIAFYNQPKIITKNIEYLSKDLKASYEVVTRLLESFTIASYNEGRSKHIKSQDLILKSFYHILVLALILKEFKLDLEPLCKSLRMDLKEILSKLKSFQFKNPKIYLKVYYNIIYSYNRRVFH